MCSSSPKWKVKRLMCSSGEEEFGTPIASIVIYARMLKFDEPVSEVLSQIIR